jgi:hypothetical protein
MKPLKIYIDNCSLNDIAPKDNDWANTVLGKYLIEKSNNGEIEVFCSPASVFEIALNKDLEQRNNMARALNTLIRGQRMMPSKEFYIVDNFLNVIEDTWSSTTSKVRLESLKENSARIFIALLGQLAALKDYDCSKGFIGVIAPKLATQVIHSQIFDNPKDEIQKRIDAIQNKQYSHLDYLKDFENLSIEELNMMQKAFEEKKYNIDKKAITLLQRNQEILINGYSLDELSFATNQVFVYSEDLYTTIIDFSKIVFDWDTKSDLEKKRNKSIKPLDHDFVNRFNDKNFTISDTRLLMKLLVNRFHDQLQLPIVSNHIIIKDIEKGLQNGKIPSGGIILDSSHCLSALFCEILFSRDQRLNASVDYWFNQIKKETGAFRETAKNIKELKRKIESGLKH